MGFLNAHHVFKLADVQLAGMFGANAQAPTFAYRDGLVLQLALYTGS